MLIESKVTSQPLSKRMYDLGWKFETERYWIYFEPTPAKYEDPIWKVRYGKGNSCWEHYPAPDIIEIAMWLPERERLLQKISESDECWDLISDYSKWIWDVECLGKMWCYLTEKGLL